MATTVTFDAFLVGMATLLTIHVPTRGQSRLGVGRDARDKVGGVGGGWLLPPVLERRHERHQQQHHQTTE